MFMPYPEKDLALTAVGGFLIIATVRHPDGAMIEYVHHRLAAHELS
jgi:hypothetical protein